MGKDYRIKGHRLLARCCYGSCLGFGFVITTITFAAMFWIIWCYLGLSFIQFSNTQRRALVNYPYVTAKTATPLPPTSSPNNLEVSLNQIPNSSTATSDVQKNDSPSILDKPKDVVHDGSSGLGKSSFGDNGKDDKTGGRDTTEELKRNPNNRGVDVKHDSSEVRTVSPALRDEQSRKDNKEDGASGIRPSETQETSTKTENIPAARSEFGKDERVTSKSYLEEDKTGHIEFSNKQSDKDSSYIDPVFIRENSRIPNREELPTRYDSRTKSEPNATLNKYDSPSKEDKRVLPDSEIASRDGPRIQSEDRYRDRLPSERRYFDSDSDQRRHDDKYSDSDRRRYRSDQSDDTPGREIRRRDRVSEDRYFNERKRPNRQGDTLTREDRYRDHNQDKRYSESRRENRDRYDERDRVTIDGKYDERYQDRIPLEDTYDARYRDRIPVEERYEERYRDRVPVDDKYDERYRVRVPVDDEYIERYPDERRRREGTSDYDDKRVREYRNRDRVGEEDRYLESDRTKSSDDKYEYRPQIDERYRDDARKRDVDSKYETRSQDDKIRSRDQYDYRDDPRPKSSDDRLLDRRYDTRDDAYRYRDRFYEERFRSDRDRNREDNIQRSTSRDSYVDRYDNKEIRGNRERTPSLRDTPDYSHSSRTDDKRLIDSPPPRERDLLSSRADYTPLPVRTGSERREYSTRNERKDTTYGVSDKEQPSINAKDYNTEMRRTEVSESRYRNGYRNQEYQGRSQYDDRDRINPTRVMDSQHFSRDKIDEEDNFRQKSFNEDRRKETSIRDNRSSTQIRGTDYQNSDDRTRLNTRIDGSIDREITGYRDRKTEGPRVIPNTRSQYDRDRTTGLKSTEEVVLDRRSYSSDDDYSDRNRKFDNPVDSRDRVNRPIYSEGRDYRYEDTPPIGSDDKYRTSRRTEYDERDYLNRGSNSRNRDIRYDNERGSNVRDQDSNRGRYNGGRDVYRDSRGGIDETSKQNRGRVDEERYEEKYESRSYDRYPSSDEGIRKVDTARPTSKDSAWDENPQSRSRRYGPENGRGSSAARGISESLQDERRFSDDESPTEAGRNRNSSPLSRDGESQKRTMQSSNNNGQLTSEITRGVSHLVSSNYDPEQPLSAKDVIDAALRHSEMPGQEAKKVFYPVFDPRVSNLTSPDTIRPSERKGITVTAKKRRKR